MLRSTFFVVTISLSMVASGGTQSVNVPPAVAPASPMASLVDRYTADRTSLLRRYAAEYSPERYARLTRFYKEWQQELTKVPFESLNVEGRLDHVLLNSRLEYELRLLAREQAWVNETATLLPFSTLITDLLEARARVETMSPEKAAVALDQIARDIDVAIKGADSVRPTSATVADAERARKINAYRAAEVLSSYKTNLQEWSRFYSGYDPMFTWWTSNPYAKADKALAAYIKTLREKIVGYKEGEDEPIIGNPIGRAGLVEDLTSEFIPYTPEELLKIAEREFAWCDREMLEPHTRWGSVRIGKLRSKR